MRIHFDKLVWTATKNCAPISNERTSGRTTTMDTKRIKQQQQLQHQRIHNTMRAFQAKWFGEFIIISCCWLVWNGLCGSTQVVPLNSFNHSTEVNQTRQPKCEHPRFRRLVWNVQCKCICYTEFFTRWFGRIHQITRNKQMEIELRAKKRQNKYMRWNF